MNKSPKGLLIGVGLFLVIIVLGIVLTEKRVEDYEYGEPYEMVGVVSDKEADKNRKNSLDSNGIAKNSDILDYNYYVYVKLENGEEIKIQCTLESDYDKYKVGQNVTILCQEMTKKGEFIQMVYSFKE